MEKGLYGQEERDFFDRHPDGAISNEMALYQCQECGALSNRPKLNLYVLKKDMKPIKGRCFTNCTLATGFDLMRSYPHTCQVCGGDVMMVADYRNYHRSMVMCPEGDDLLTILEE
ncbi:MAG: hypothetical protein KBS83_02240 [Lachnospiraceae bacterium]|nr:hypothetical protein [Candidatus Equihabitans merdae]